LKLISFPATHTHTLFARRAMRRKSVSVSGKNMNPHGRSSQSEGRGRENGLGARGHFCAAHYFIPVRVKVCSKQPVSALGSAAHRREVSRWLLYSAAATAAHRIMAPYFPRNGCEIQVNNAAAVRPSEREPARRREWYYRPAEWSPGFICKEWPRALRKS
jgi:hypothetical protein